MKLRLVIARGLAAAALAFSLAAAAQPRPMLAEQVDLIRHGESEDNPDAGQPIVHLSGRISASPGKVLSGWNAVPLTMRGVHQAVQAGEVLKAREPAAAVPMKHALWIYSPLLRTQQTLAGVLAGAGLADGAMLQAARPDTRLFERSAGTLTNLTWEQAAGTWDEMKKGRDAGVFRSAAFGYPGGESLESVYRRSSVALDEALRENRRVVIVSHELTIKTMLAHLLNRQIDDRAFAFKVENGKPITLRRVGAEWMVDRH